MGWWDVAQPSERDFWVNGEKGKLMTVRERISTAQRSHDLSEVLSSEIGDIDIVRATGMVGKKMPVAVSLWRLKYSDDRREYRAVVEGLITLMVNRGWDESEVLELVPIVVNHWMNDVCRPCNGRGYERVTGTPMLSDAPCLHCDGQGRSQCPDSGDSALWLTEAIAGMERSMALAIMERINRMIK